MIRREVWALALFPVTAAMNDGLISGSVDFASAGVLLESQLEEDTIC